MTRFPIILRTVLFAALCVTAAAPSQAANPLLTPSDAPFGAPRLDRIHAADFPQAFTEHLRAYEALVDSVRAVAPESACFENVIIPLNRAAAGLRKTQATLNYLRNNFGGDSLLRIYEATAPAITEATDRTDFDPHIISLLSALYQRRDAFDSLRRRTIECMYRSRVARGALLGAEQQQRLTAIQTELSLKQSRYGQNVIRATEEYVFFVSDSNALAGIPRAARQRMARRAWEMNRPWEWAIGFSGADYSTVLHTAADRSLRERLYRDYAARCSSGDANDNRQLAADILNLRLERARLLGRATYADLAIEGNMAAGPEQARDLMDRLLRAAVDKAQTETDELEALARREQGPEFVLEPWDFLYYRLRLRQERFGNDLDQVSRYLLLDNVCEGVFRVAERLYGIRLVRRRDIPVSHPDVWTFEAKDRDGSTLGVVYLDCFARKGKRSGAWTSRLRPYALTEQGEELPLVTVSCNFTRAPKGRTQTLSLPQVRVLFHEFGHALALLLARGPYPQVTGNYPTDMGELPSQLMEHWASEPKSLKSYARHYQSGKPIPYALIDRIHEEQSFQQGARLASSYTLALLDLELHGITEPVTADEVNAVADTLRARYGIPRSAPLTDPTVFNHIFSGRYAAEYYAYAWASVLDTDAFAAFTETGDPYDPVVAARLRRYILTEIGYDTPARQYIRFRGRMPEPDALMERHGLKTAAEPGR